MPFKVSQQVFIYRILKDRRLWFLS